MFNFISDIDLSERLHQAKGEDKQRALTLLRDRALGWYMARDAFRVERIESRNDYRGRQYEYLVEDDDGNMVKAKDYIQRQGRVTVALNLTANIINNMHGQFLVNKSDRAVFATSIEGDAEAKALDMALRASRRRNSSHVIEADNAREHFLSGASCFKSVIKWDPKLNRHEVKDARVDQTRLFYNMDIRDRRLDGLNMIGELHDATYHQIVSQFARSQKEAEEIKGKLDQAAGSFGHQQYGHDVHDSINFFGSIDPGMNRLIETWVQSYDWVRFGYDPLWQITEGYDQIVLNDAQIAKIQNERRELGLPLLELDEKRFEPTWRYYIMTPEAQLISEGQTPYWHGEHPYTNGLAMHMDGETWGAISNVKDPQRWLNRLVSQIDHGINTSGKGALGVDQEVLQNSGKTAQDVLEAYTRADGIVDLALGGKSWDQVIKQLPHGQMNNNVVNLIPMIVSFVERISGVNDAAQGFAPKAGTPASLYNRQIVQASTNAFGYLSSYYDALHLKDRKEVQLIQQSHQERRVFSESVNGRQLTVEYDPDRVMNIDADVAIADVDHTPTQRQQNEDMLFQLAQTGMLPIEIYLAMSGVPKATEALEMLQQMKAAAAEQQTMPPGTDEAMAALSRVAA